MVIKLDITDTILIILLIKGCLSRFSGEHIYTFYVRDDEYSSIYKITLTSFSEDSIGPTINVLSIY